MDSEELELPLGKRTFWYRFWEIVPGALSYIVLALPIVLSFISALLGALFVILYIASWLVKAVAMAYRTVQGYNKIESGKKINWAGRLHDLEHAPEVFADMKKRRKSLSSEEMTHYRALRRYVSLDKADKLLPTQVYNLVIVPTYNESREVLEPTIKMLIESDYDVKHNLIFILAYEHRGGKKVKELAHSLIKEYRNNFYYAAAIEHPTGLPNEIIGKGGNITYAGHHFVDQWLNKQDKITADQIIVTTLDSDNRPHRKYFAAVTYLFLTTKDRYRKAFQPPAMFTNNIWDAPAPMRVIATGNTFYNLVLGQRTHLLRNFSAHSQSLSGLIKTNFWSTRSIVEDGHQFWRSYFAFDGDYEVIAVNLPIYQDATMSDTLKKTLKAQFIQLRRWAYGASDIPYVATRVFTRKRKVPFFDGVGKLMRLMDTHISWATVAFITLFGAWAPLYFGRNADRSIVAHQLPIMASWAQRIATVGLVVMVYFSWRLLPPRPERYKRHRSIWMVLQWVYMPITGICYNSFAALYSQTRLLLGRYMDKFDVTDKAVVKKDMSKKL